MTRLLRNSAWLTVTVRCAECSRTAQCDVQLTRPPAELSGERGERVWELPADEGALEAPAAWARVPAPGPDPGWADLLCPTCAGSQHSTSE